MTKSAGKKEKEVTGQCIQCGGPLMGSSGICPLCDVDSEEDLEFPALPEEKDDPDTSKINPVKENTSDGERVLEPLSANSGASASKNASTQSAKSSSKQSDNKDTKVPNEEEPNMTEVQKTEITSSAAAPDEAAIRKEVEAALKKEYDQKIAEQEKKFKDWEKDLQKDYQERMKKLESDYKTRLDAQLKKEQEIKDKIAKDKIDFDKRVQEETKKLQETYTKKEQSLNAEFEKKEKALRDQLDKKVNALKVEMDKKEEERKSQFQLKQKELEGRLKKDLDEEKKKVREEFSQKFESRKKELIEKADKNAQLAKKELEKKMEEFDKKKAALEKDLESTKASLEKSLEEKKKHLEDQIEKQKADYQKRFESKKQELISKAEKNQRVKEKEFQKMEESLKKKTDELSSKDKELAKKTKQLEKAQNDTEKSMKTTEERSRELKAKEEALGYKDNEISRREEELVLKEKQLKDETLKAWREAQKEKNAAEKIRARLDEEAKGRKISDVDVKDFERREKELVLQVNQFRKKEQDLKEREDQLTQKVKEFAERVKKEGSSGTSKMIDLRVLVAREIQKARAETGIRRFDDLLYGGVPFGSNVLLKGPSNIGKEQFYEHFLINGIRNGVPTIIFAANSTPDQIRNRLDSLMVDFEDFEKEGLIKFIDIYSRKVDPFGMDIKEKEDPNIYPILNYKDTGEIIQVMDDIIETVAQDVGYFRMFFPLSRFITNLDQITVLNCIEKLCNKSKMAQGVTFYSLDSGMHNEIEINTVINLMDGVVTFNRNKERNLLNVQGICEVQTRSWVEFTYTNDSLDIIGSFVTEKVL